MELETTLIIKEEEAEEQNVDQVVDHVVEQGENENAVAEEQEEIGLQIRIVNVYTLTEEEWQQFGVPKLRRSQRVRKLKTALNCVGCDK